MNWQPRGFFGADQAGGAPFNAGGGALSMPPGLLGLLSDARES